MRICILGCGAMGEALLAGLCKSGWPRKLIWIVEQNTSRLQELSGKFRVRSSSRPEPALRWAQVFVLAVKPAEVRGCLPALRRLSARQTVISLAAGIRLSRLARALPKVNLVRAMPNLGARHGEGASAFSLGRGARNSSRRIAQKILGAVGLVVEVPESQLDAVTALSGCGPAYFFQFALALARAGQSLGLSRKIATALAGQTLRAAGALLSENPDGMEDWIRKVATRGGATEAALKILARENFQSAIQRALSSARRRTKALGDFLA